MNLFQRIERAEKVMDTKWRKVPKRYQELLIPILNYFFNAFIISFVFIYFFLWDVLWFRYLFLVPCLTIILAYFEHYYHWLRLGYKD